MMIDNDILKRACVALLAGLLGGCAMQPSPQSPMSSAISSHTHDGLVLVDDQSGLPAVDPAAWEAARNDNPRVGVPGPVRPGATFIERRRRDRLHTINGRPRQHFRQTIEIHEHRIQR